MNPHPSFTIEADWWPIGFPTATFSIWLLSGGRSNRSSDDWANYTAWVRVLGFGARTTIQWRRKPGPKSDSEQLNNLRNVIAEDALALGVPPADSDVDLYRRVVRAAKMSWL